MDAYNTINDILVHLFNEIWELEKKAIITEEFKDITNNDMHIIEAIGVSGKTTMSVVAKKMKITAGSLTTAVNGLVNKKYVMRARGEEDRRVVYIWLTEKGEKAYHHHEKFHEDMIQSLLKDLSEEETKTLVSALTNLRDFFQDYK